MSFEESGEAWRSQVLEEWNDTGAPYPRDASIPELFEEHVRRAPGALALRFPGGQMTYAELDARADDLAGVLLEAGVGPDQLVGLCLERSAEAIVAILAILKAGGAFAPLDPAYPPDRLAFMLEDTAAPVLVTRRELLARLPETSARVICLEDLNPHPPAPSPGPPESPAPGEGETCGVSGGVGVSGVRGRPSPGAGGLGRTGRGVGGAGGEDHPFPDNLAYVMYTSGSTGRPKGVAVTHRNVARLARSSGFADFGPDHVFLHLGPLSFDATTLEVAYSLLNGAALAIPPAGTPSLEELGAFLVDQGVTAAWLTAGLFHQMVEAQLPSLGGLRLIMSGGDVLSPPHVARVLEAFPGITMVNGYGPTESTVFACCHPMHHPSEVESPLPIGRPIGNTRVVILDPDLRMVPPGAEGELCIGGDGLARGYLHRPDLTADRFVPDAFWTDGGRLYRTGDLARWRDDGVLEFLGRVDLQVKIRGFRVELGEIEAALVAHPDVADAAVVVQGEGGDKRLVAFWSARGVARSSEEPDLRAFLTGQLPPHLIPSAFVKLDALPLNTNGKVDRRVLATTAIPERGGDPAETLAAPVTPTEEVLAALWAELLRLDRVGIDEDFFELGGHSLVATRLVSRLSSELGVSLSLRAVFENPTVAALAARVDEARGTGEQAPPVVPRLHRAGELLPASFAQERLWILDRLTPGQAVYNIPLGLHLRGVLQIGAVDAALRTLTRRHDSLRTTFAEVSGAPRQRIAPAAPRALPIVDLRGLPAALSFDEARRVRETEGLRPFDLDRGPLLRTVLLRVADEDSWLLLNMHHIVSDGWSMEVLTRELAVLYGGETLAVLPVQYADFAAWQRDWLKGDVLRRQIDWWVEELAGAPTLLELPADRPRPPVPSFRGVRLELALPAALAAGVSRLAREGGATLFITLLAAFQELLGRHAGHAADTADVLVGSPVANRGRREVEGVIGFFANTLVLRGRLGRGSFRDRLARVRTSALGAYVHQDLPFERLVEELRIERSASYNPLFQAAFAFQPPPMQGLELPGLDFELEDLQGLTAKFDLFLSLWESPDGFAGTLDIAADLFDAETAERFARRFQVLLEAIVEQPDRSMDEHPLLAAGERSQVLEDWNDTRFPYPREACLHELFAEQARKTPDAVALRFPGGAGREELTYAELDARSGALAGALVAAGVGPDRLVGLCLERSAEAIVAMLAILKAGGAFAPLDPNYPADRLAFMLEDTAAPVLVTRRALLARLPGTSARVLCLEDLSPHPPAPSPGPPESPSPGEGETCVVSEGSGVSGVRGRPSPGAGGLGRTGRGVGGEGPSPSNLAYVMYTSGSTGRPKGVAVTHRNVVRLVRNTNFADFGAHPSFLQLAPLSFDASTLEIWAPLLNGGTLVVHPPEAPSLAELGAFVARERITSLWLTAGLFHQMVEAQLGSFRGVEQLFAGGDVLSPPHVARVLRELPGITLINGYGPTESTTFACCYPMQSPMQSPMRSPADLGATVPIGRPIGNTTVAILDRGFQPVPPGVAGELYIGGDGLARGYLNRPDLTAERFVPDPVLGEGERLYRTGDLARWLPDGVVEFLGRADQQVKIRGFRIEPGEIESALAGHTAVAEACVVVQGDGADKRLVAFWVAARLEPGRAEKAVGDPDLRGFLDSRLPAHLVPAAFVRLDSMPLNPNGKVDRRVLAAAFPTADPGAERAEAAPRTPTEEVLAGIWASLLRLDRVGVDEDFFVLGGHSLLATRMISRLAADLGVELSLRTLFEQPTVAGLAVRIEEALAAGAKAPPIVPVPREAGERIPLSYSQEGLWLVDRLTPGLPVYNIPLTLRLTGDQTGDLNVERLEAALNEVVRRHESLRTTFRQAGGRPWQEIAPFAPRPLPVVDLRSRPDAAGPRLRQEAGLPFDLAAGPLLRCLLVVLGEREHVLLLVLHHIVGDGWSLEALTRDLGAFYRGETLPGLPVQYADYAVWQRRWLAGEALQSQVDWWRDELAGAPRVLDLPADRPRPAQQSFRGAMVEDRLPAELIDAVRELARREGVTLFMALLVAWQSLLSRMAGPSDVPGADLLVGSPVANRDRPELGNLIGFFVNTLVLRGRFAESTTFLEALAKARRSALGAYAHQDLPFDQLVAELRVERSLAHTPLIQVLFALQAGAFPLPDLPGVQVEAATLSTGTAKFDLLLEARETAAGFGLSLEHATDLFDASTAVRILERFGVLLSAAVAAPGRPLADLPLMSETERFQVLKAWSGGASEGLEAPGLCLHELVAGQIGRTPDAVAVLGDDGSRWTYRELGREAGAIAARLQELGVGPESPVGVALPRTPRLVAALLGVLRAGGCYLPLDPAYPKGRLSLLLEDTRAQVVITESGLLDLLPGLPGTALLLDRETLPEADPSPSRALPGNLAYLIYTSGSTGRPKGVAIEHRSASAFAVWARGVFGEDELAGVFAGTSINFDLSVFEIFVPLCWGGRVVLGADALALPRHPAAAGVRLVNTVPSVMAELMAMRALPASVRTVSLAGEPLRRALAREIAESGTVDRLLNLYGPSEDTTYSTWTAISISDGGDEQEPAIGRPLAGTKAYVLDRNGSPSPIGMGGELFLGGAGLARGYFGRPDLTAERFVPDPFGEPGGPGEPGERLYRTGDLCRWLSSGELDYLGRIDHQVKLRGFRIELGEIEAALAAHPGVRHAAVLVRGEGAGRRLVACVAPDSGVDLRAHLAARLPEYMLPAAFVGLAAMPLTPNGKVDRRALAAAVDARLAEPQGTAVSAGPRTPTEEVIAGFWTDILELGHGTDGITDIDQDFFALGGHSLLGTRLVSRVGEALGLDLPLRALFESPTVRTLAAHVDAVLSGQRGALRPSLRPLPRDGRDLPLSFAQERLWFLDRLEPGQPFYNMPFAVGLDGPLDIRALSAALNGLVHRHETLRTVFPSVAGEPRQRVEPFRARPLPVVDLTGLPDAGDAAAAEAGRRLELEGRRPFSLESGPLLRTFLMRLAPERHELLVVLHHSVADGWSLDVIRAEMEALYLGKELPPLPIQYADYAVWQRQWLRGEALEKEAAYWRGELAGAPTLLELPLDRPRPAVQSYRGATLPAAFPPELAEAARSFARSRGATSFMTLLAAFQALLHRISANAEGSDVVVGSPIANRGRRELEGLIGFFVNTLAFHGRFGEEGLSFDHHVARTRAAALAAYAHQNLPFDRVVEELRLERSLSYSPLVQVLFSVQDAPGGSVSLGDVTADWRVLPLQAAKVDLDLTLDDRLQGVAGYASDLFDAATVERMLGHLGVMLAAAVAHPDRPLAGLPLLTENERGQLQAWEGSAAGTGLAPVPVQLASRAALSPDAVAVELAGAGLTYRELHARAAALAARLRALGVGAGIRVGLLLERSPDLPACILGIWYAGGAYVPLDPHQPEARLDFLIEDAIRGQAAAVIVSREPRSLPGVEIVALSGLQPARVDPGDGAPPSPSGLAYLIYTSGTTGQPKAVQVTHGNLAHTLAGAGAAFGFEASDRMPCLAAFTFDIFLFELFCPLLAGGTSVIFPLRPTLDVPALVDALDGMTLLHAVPALMREVVDLAVRRGTGRTLRRLFVGGDAVPVDLLAAMRSAFPQARITVLYGPTEATILCSSHEVAGDEDRALLGRPLPGCVLELRDRNGQPVPVGVPGEVWIGGPGVTAGYLHQPILTSETFVDGLYRSGDLARRLPDGVLEFLGRRDNQVKLRGFRIELGEIEAVLAQHPAVRQAAVLVAGEGSGRHLAAFVVEDEGDPEESRETGLRELAASRLPEYMVPSTFTFLDALPLTAHGKMDRKELALRAPARVRGEGEWIAPRTATEAALAGLWSSVLGVERVGRGDHFFDLGGHSLLATRLISRIAEGLGAELSLRVLFEAPVLSDLASRVDAALAEGLPKTGSPLGADDSRDGDFPLSFAQERLWFLDQLDPGSAHYNIATPMRLGGALDVPKLQAALREIVRRHEILRTTYGERNGRGAQRVAPANPAFLAVMDLSGLPAETAEAEMMRLAREEEAAPFDLRRGPVHRFRLVRIQADGINAADALLMLTVHHIASDGWSTGILVQELSALYSGESLAPLPVQYGDFAVWQRRWLQGDTLDQLLDSWRKTLAGAPERIALPTDRPRPANRSVRGVTRPLTLPADLVARIGAVSRRLGATPFMTLLAVYETVLRRVSGQDDFLVGTPVAGRTRAEVEGVVGCFVNTLVLRAKPDGELSFRELVSRVRATSLHAFAHQDLPFEKLVEGLGVERGLGRNPLFQVFFALANTPMDEPRLRGLSFSFVDIASEVSLFDLSLGLGELRGRMLGGFQYAADLFEESTVDRWARHFQVLLEAALADPEAALAGLPGIPEPERLQIVAEAAAETPEESAEALQDRLASRGEELAERRSALSEEKRAALKQLLRARARPK